MSRSGRIKMVAFMGILLHCATMRMFLVEALPSPAPALPVGEIPVGSVDDVKRLSGLKTTTVDASTEPGVAGGQHTLLEAATSQTEAPAYDDNNLSYLFDGLMSSATRGMPAGMRRLDQLLPTGSERPNSALHDLPNVNPGDFLRPETLMAAAAGNRQATASSARRRDQLADIVDNGAFNRAGSSPLEDGRYPSAELVSKLSNYNDNYNRLALASAMRFQQSQQRKQTGDNQRRQMAPVAGRRSSNGRVANRKQQQQRLPVKTQRRSGGRVGGRGRVEQRESTGSDEYDELDERSDSGEGDGEGDDEGDGDETAGSRSERRAANSEREVFGELADGPEEENEGETKRSASGEGDELGDDEEAVEPMVRQQQRPRPRPQATSARSQRRQSTGGQTGNGRRSNQQGRKVGANAKRRAAAAAAATTRQRGDTDESRNQLTTSGRSSSNDYAGESGGGGDDEISNQDEAASHVRQSTTDLQTAAGHHHGHHGHYYQYVEVPKKKTWKFGFKRGNHKHEIMKHEKGHKHKFHTEFKWHAKEKCKKKSKCKSVGKMTWDYKHHKHHHG